MADVIRIAPEEVRKKVTSGAVLLVCAYDNEEKFKQFHVEGAISLSEFRSKLPFLNKDHEIIFYCAWPKEATSAGQAEKYTKEGFRNAKVLDRGVEGWKKAGYPFIKS
jgi:rhodanese-related sulfurtransferase